MSKVVFFIIALCWAENAFAAEAWTCDFPRNGKWEIVGDKLVRPPGDFVPTGDDVPVVQNTPEAVIALSDPKAGRFMLVTIHKRTGHLKITAFGLEGNYEDHFEGKCSPIN
jgi:hypothetical protein